MILARISFGTRSYLAQFNEHLGKGPHEDQTFLCQMIISGRPKSDLRMIKQLASVKGFCGDPTSHNKFNLQHDELIVAAKVGTNCFNTTDVAFMIYTKIEG
jgi:hypothetical protein